MNIKLQDDRTRIQQIPIDIIRPNPYQPRKDFDNVCLDELAESIRAYGILQPLTVRKTGKNMYELVTGERRLRAAISLSFSTVPCIVADINDDDSAIIALIENLQRKDLNYFEEAEAFYYLIEEHGFTQEELALRTGKKQSTIANKLRILKLPPFIKTVLQDNGLSERHARALLRLPDQQTQWRVLMKIVEKNLNVSATDRYVDELLSKQNEDKLKTKPILKGVSSYKIFLNTIKKALDMVKDAGVSAKTRQIEHEDCYEYIIRISK